MLTMTSKLFYFKMYNIFIEGVIEFNFLERGVKIAFYLRQQKNYPQVKLSLFLGGGEGGDEF